MKLSALQQPTGLALQAKPTTPSSPEAPPTKLTATGLDAFEKSAPTPPRSFASAFRGKVEVTLC
jgi:hypothetical protein